MPFPQALVSSGGLSNESKLPLTVAPPASPTGFREVNRVLCMHANTIGLGATCFRIFGILQYIVLGSSAVHRLFSQYSRVGLVVVST